MSEHNIIYDGVEGRFHRLLNIKNVLCEVTAEKRRFEKKNAWR